MWTCKKCGEAIEDTFDSCWKCAESSGPQSSDTGPKYSTKCLACGSEKLVKGIKAVDKELLGATTLSIQYSPQGDGTSFLPRIINSPTVALVCGDCGFISYYATNYQAIYAAFIDTTPEEKA
jgi:hypothetical protein